MEALELLLTHMASMLKLALEAIAVLAVAVGLIDAVLLAARVLGRRSAGAFTDFRLRFGRWLVIALEFQLGADIVGTTVSPTPEALAQLGVVAVIRTFLNYFLNRELAELGTPEAEAPVAGGRPRA